MRTHHHEIGTDRRRCAEDAVKCIPDDDFQTTIHAAKLRKRGDLLAKKSGRLAGFEVDNLPRLVVIDDMNQRERAAMLPREKRGALNGPLGARRQISGYKNALHRESCDM
jgi:hypothetical protein